MRKKYRCRFFFLKQLVYNYQHRRKAFVSATTTQRILRQA